MCSKACLDDYHGKHVHKEAYIPVPSPVKERKKSKNPLERLKKKDEKLEKLKKCMELLEDPEKVRKESVWEETVLEVLKMLAV